MPGRRVVPGRAAQLRRARLPRPRRRATVAIRHASELRELGELTLGRAARRRSRAVRRRPARARRRRAATASSPTCRTSPRPSSPSSPRASLGADLVELLAGLRRPAASSTASPRSSRRCCSPSTATATAARTSTGATSSPSSQARDAEPRAHRRRSPTSTPEPDLGGARATRSRWDELLATPATGAELAFERVPFDHPLWVLYSSGTTGLPKAIVQGHGGILLEQLKKLHLHLDAQPGDRVFWFTTTGWMMWNFLVGGLLTDGVDRPLRRQPRPPRHGRALGPRRARRA